MKGDFGWNATKTYNGWEFNRPQEPLMSEKTPRLRPVEVVNRQPLNADQQRRLGQISITDGVYIPRHSPEEESCYMAEVMEDLDNTPGL